ncbi:MULTISPECIES: MFS transporter [unclassified Microbacterium]|uniref:MFS transporter n=1 Tax=unclassified Microbacterium TaxID=2609290 RepID=UPI0024693492|nr:MULTISPECIES: MFS transporter [unclassified Microbacterium]MDH5132679.1 MFS transporter [Microbacterium sp. RD10]MDH5136190.1 MFS transporter [Microbacterium sp. RD11]MDH5145171.1 MFS transporter [Microbacterium sp. RD12]MDH5154968.1 MFS transporter [Microbacterium sp. RD06]MDH5165674.1 MFS transporter [Microbacterium sp. RD02]
MTHTSTTPDTAEPSLFRLAGLPYFLIAFIARLPFAMMVVGVLTVVVSARGSLSLGGLTSAAVGLGTACFGPLLGAAADRFGQRTVLLALAVGNAAMLLLFTAVVYGPAADGFVLLAAIGIGATAPQVAPLSRSRLVTIIGERMPAERRARTVSGTMAYESAADETVFVFGPFLVGVLASALAPWAPLVGAAALTLVFVGAFALHPSGRHVSQDRTDDGRAPSAVSELFRPQLLIVVLGILGVGIFFGTMLTSLTSFMADLGAPEQAGLLYGVMGVGSAVLALGVAWLPVRFSLRARWLVFSGILLAGSLLLGIVDSPAGMMLALAIMGIGIGPTLVTQYSFGAARSPRGRSATVMTMLGSGVIVGQSIGAAVAGEIAESLGTSAALVLPMIAAGIAFAAGLGNWALSGVHRAASAVKA